MPKTRHAIPHLPRKPSHDYFRRYYQAHHEHILAHRRAYYAANRFLEQDRSRNWRHAHSEYVSEYNRRYAQENRERIRVNRRARHAARHPFDGQRVHTRVADLLEDPAQYILETMGIELRPYQAEPLQRILESIENHLGDTIVLMFPRQSGKDEFLLDLMVYLADLYSMLPVGIVAVNPTYKPQTVTALQRFDAALEADNLTRGAWRSQGGFMRILGQARISFLSGEPRANVTGATASLLLIVNEAQDISPQVYRQKFEPMAASMNATRILAGNCLDLTHPAGAGDARRIAGRAGRRSQARVHGRRGRGPPGCSVVRRACGRNRAGARGQHPLVKTQYFNEEIDAETGMFNAARRALMAGDQSGQTSRMEGHTYVFCVDVAGQDESRLSIAGTRESPLHDLPALANASRDSTTLSIMDVDLSTLATLHAPTYRVVQRLQWTGLNHLVIFGKLKALADQWRPQHIVIDATGVGEGLWAMLDKALPTRVIPVKFSAEKKSEIGYRFISLIETGRFRDCWASDAAQSSGSRANVAHSGDLNRRSSQAPTRATVDRQYSACQAEVLIGPRKTMRWGVPDGTRDENGELIHDDIVLADALVTEVDALEWTIRFESCFIPGIDLLEEMSRFRME